jgi:hypothetical protein
MCYAVTIKYTCEHYEFDGFRLCLDARKSGRQCSILEGLDEDAGFQCQECEPNDWNEKHWLDPFQEDL